MGCGGSKQQVQEVYQPDKRQPNISFAKAAPVSTPPNLPPLDGFTKKSKQANNTDDFGEITAFNQDVANQLQGVTAYRNIAVISKSLANSFAKYL